MELEKKISPTKLGNPNYVNPNCWVAMAINGPPYERCRYCIKSYKQCPIFRYIIVSLGLVSLSLVGTFFIERELWGSFFKIILFSDFIFVIVYGYFYNKVTVEIIKAEYEAKKILEIKIEQKTKELRETYKKVEKAYEVEKRAHKELKRLDEAKDQFIMATQHHLRTPLTSMIGYLDLIFGETYGKVPAELKETLLKFQISTRRLIKIVDEFLDITQFQLGKEVVTLKPNIDIRPILKEIMEELQFEAKARGIYLKLQKPGKIPRIKADPEKLKIALSNIVDNGIKYTPKGGVTIKFKIEKLRLRIITQDTGMGIPKEELKTLFTRTFERSKEAKKVYGTGRGIGLFITGHIIKAHNGKIWAESEGKGKGSTFYIELPVK